MKHHFGDHLDRTGDYWTIIPNIERYFRGLPADMENKSAVKILTISKHHEHWTQVLDLPNLEELTLHDPNKEQVLAVRRLSHLKRLRLSFFRATDIGFIGDLTDLEELVLEYVSGFSDLTPLSKLPKLKSVHFENLRRVSSFDGLRGCASLRYLHIDGTLDWNQPIENFEFLRELPKLEVFSLGFVTNKTEYPALLPVLHLQNLSKIRVGRNTFSTREYAFLQAALPNVAGASFDLCWAYNGNYEFLGKRAGFVKIDNPTASERCGAFTSMFERMKEEAVRLIESCREG